MDMRLWSLVGLALMLSLFAIVIGCGGGGKGVAADCRDGTQSYSRDCAAACSNHGGVAAWLIDACESKAISIVKSHTTNQ